MNRQKPSLGVIFLTVLLDLLGFGLVMPFLALQARDTFGVEASTAALLGTVYSGLQFLCMPLWGRLSDRIGRRPVMLWSVLASALSMAALGTGLAFGHSVLWLFLARGASGAATANIGTASAYIADITTPEERVKGMGLIGMAFGIGFVVGPGVGGLLSALPINGREGPLACFAAGALSLINFVWAYFALPESLPASRRRQAAGERGSRLAGLRSALATPGIARAATTSFLIILAFAGLENTYALFVKDTFGMSQRQVGSLFVFMGLLGALVQGGFMRRASGLYRETSLTFVGVVLQLVAFVGIVLSATEGTWLLLVASASLAIGNGFTQPSISAYVSRLADPARQGETLSGVQSLSSLGRVFGPLLAGHLYTIAPRLPFGGGALILLLGLVVALGMRGIQPQARETPAAPATS
jgi:MFS transporter, DHA1 family, tetracycline resistance protein